MNVLTPHRADEWLQRDAPAPVKMTAEQMLAANAALPPHTKLILARNGEPRLRLERPLDPDRDLDAETSAAFERAMSLLTEPCITAEDAEDAENAEKGETNTRQRGDAFTLRFQLSASSASFVSSADHSADSALNRPDSQALTLTAIADLCAEAGWTPTLRETRVTADLDCADFFQAQLTPLGGGLAIRVEVAQLGAAGAESAEAAREFLLRAGGLVRFARPVVIAGAAIFEVTFSTQPTAMEIGDALGALSIACRLAGRETALLAGDENIAREYRAMLARITSRGLQTTTTKGT